jgi:SAM-dependent methyltransferase
MVTESGSSNSLTKDKSSLSGIDYLVRGGPLDSLVFQVQFGHIRAYRSMDDLRGGGDLDVVTSEFALALPVGPAMPKIRNFSLNTLLETSVSTDDIRETFCYDMTGLGYELGPGRRPTIVPSGCTVTYVDRFSFEEAATGSFIGMDNRGFAKVKLFEAMDELASIPTNSANFFIAAHVIEHVPNVLKAFRTTIDRLAVGGRFFLVVPHKEYTFDRLRPVTTLEHFISDDVAVLSPLFEHYLEYARLAKHSSNWIEDGTQMHKEKADFHVHTFVPDSMKDVLTYLRSQTPVFDFEIKVPKNLNELGEFYVVIKKIPL